MSNPQSSSISQASILELRAITAEHVDRFTKEGKAAVKGSVRRPDLAKSKDPFNRPSPGLVKRLAAEARSDAKRRHFQDAAGPSDEQRREILKAKAKKYDALRRGDFSGMTEKEVEESVIDFERKWGEDAWSDHSSDVDESASAPRPLAGASRTDVEDDLERVEYVDELGRSRLGTRMEARDAQRAAARQRPEESPRPADNSSYAEVLQSKVIHGDQNFFPVYEPDPDAIRAKYRAAEEEARAHHYDSTKEVRAKGAGQYQFSLDEEKRAEQMSSLKAERAETERARKETGVRGGLSAAQAAQKRKLEERRALIEAKKVKLLGGREAVERLRAERRAAEVDSFLQSIDTELGNAEGKGSGSRDASS